MKQKLIALLLLALSAATPAQSTPADEGAVAASGRWYMRDGCPSRTAVAVDGGVDGVATAAWSITFKGAIEGEPVVWDDTVVVAEATKEKERILHVYRLRDGRELAKRVFATTAALEPTIWEQTIFVRASPDSLQAIAVGKDSLTTKWTYASKTKAALGAPLVHQDEIYVLENGARLLRLKQGAPQPLWAAEGPFRGRISLRGKHLYLNGQQMGKTGVVVLDRSDGKRRGGEAIDGAATWSSEATDEPFVAVFEKEVLAYNHQPHEVAAEGVAANACWFQRQITGQGKVDFSAETYVHITGEPTESLDGWIACGKDPDDGLILMRSVVIPKSKNSETKHGYAPLADSKINPRLAQAAVGSSRAGDVVFIGAQAFDLNDGAIVLENSTASIARAVPARRTLLVSETKQKLVALRAERKNEAPALAVKTDDKGARLVVAGGTVVTTDGAVIAGDYEIDPVKNIFLKPDPAKKMKTTSPLSELLLGLDEGGAIVYAAARDAALTGVESYLESAATKGTKETVAERTAAAVWHMQKTLRPDADQHFRFDLLAMTAAIDEKNPDLVQAVRKFVPTEITGGGAFKVAEWIDFAEVAARRSIKVIPPPKLDDKGPLTDVQREIGSLAVDWKRPDVFGFQSDRLLVIAPTALPGRLAWCIDLGEFTCEILEAMFAKGTNRRDKRMPLVVQIYESRDEFMKRQLDRIPQEYRAQLAGEYAKIAGFYDLLANRSRFFLADDEEFERLLPVTAHELTHHWLVERCPILKSGDGLKGSGVPGHWIVEGFAMFVEEFQLDLRRRTWNPFNPRSESLDVVASAEPDFLIPWKTVFSLYHSQVNGLPAKDIGFVPLRRHVGRYQPSTMGTLFYAQASAACHYLYHAENGKHRQALFEYLADHYQGMTEKDEIKQAFGLDADDLGRRIKAWCEGVLDGKIVASKE